ncbi:hypothetical protein GCM10022631_10720 [Deinococcus rubellus]|uniref:hypothetical protein n=1 Tax=Deinococcus rubellus TaxID=1889240 RepID=UPI0031E5E2B4
MGILLTMVGVAALLGWLVAGNAGKLRGPTERQHQVIRWSLIGAVLLGALGTWTYWQAQSMGQAKSASQLQAEDDAAVAAATEELSVTAAAARAAADPPLSSYDQTTYKSHDDPDHVRYVVVGGVPDGWSIALNENDIEPYFSSSRLLVNTASEVTARCNWYTYQSEDFIEHTAFKTSLAPDDALWSSFKPALADPGNAPLFLDTLDALCAHHPPDAVVTRENVWGGHYDDKESSLSIFRQGRRLNVTND